MGNSEFTKRYAKLNNEQKEAVNNIDGPLLVLAGPGTGKTELLSVRVANILLKTDTLAQNILCLTFTDAATLNMQNRLRSIIGDSAYDTQINTYHSFAGEIITTYPDYFRNIDLESGKDFRLERPIDEIRQTEIIYEITKSLDFDNPLRNDYYADDIKSTISDLKQATISPDNLNKTARDNIKCIQKTNKILSKELATFKSMPRKASDAITTFESLCQHLINSDCGDLAKIASQELYEALETAKDQNSTKSLTSWKNSWLSKDTNNNWVFSSIEQNEKLIYLAEVYFSYQEKLKEYGEYDFNDMILKSIDAIERNPELKYNLQEKYQYILLDEFQDTNAAQFKLIRLLADNPVNEGRPNIMAVGDDDQGIFAFQGAHVGNMISFVDTFRDVKIVNLTSNYRSHHQILHAAHNIANQIENRLHHNMQNITKDLKAASKNLPKDAEIARHEFKSESSELGWISEKIKSLIDAGENPKEISIIAPKHKILESVVPFLNNTGIPVTYEKRENIIDTEIVSAIYDISCLLIAISRSNYPLIDELMPKVLSYDFWSIDPMNIWNVNWAYSKNKYDEYLPWADIAIEDNLKKEVQFLIELGIKSNEIHLENALDYIVGVKPMTINKHSFASPIYEYYFSNDNQSEKSQEFFETVSHLSVIRSHLRELQRNSDIELKLTDFVAFIDGYKKTGKSLINSHPIVQNENSVTLQTVYKSKGLEYDFVFLPSMNDDLWGKSAKSNSSKISLPNNLKHIRHISDNEDTKRRLLFVAITRAKKGLIITNYAQKDNGKKTIPAKYLLESDSDGSKISGILPENQAKVNLIERDENITWQDIKTSWFTKHIIIEPKIRDLLSERIKYYTMSPTHLNSFTNLEYSSPQDFYMGTILRFPHAPTASSIYGDTFHKTLEYFQKNNDNSDSLEASIDYYKKIISKSFLEKNEKDLLSAKGITQLENYIKTRESWLRIPSEIEVDFRREGVTLGNAKLTGKIDRLEVDNKQKTTKVIDFKTGKPMEKWSSDYKSISYKQQLLFYKYLIENSNRFRGYKVESASLEFVEIQPPNTVSLELVYNDED